MIITKVDVIWNFAATILKVAAGVLILPLVLHILPAEDVGLWTIFVSVGAMSFLLDFGFGDSFARNITYIFSGVKNLQKTGHETVIEKTEIDYSLLKGTIIAMRRFYGVISLFLLTLLTTLGSYYIYTVLKNYHGDRIQVFFAWGAYCILAIYQLYTLYYDALLRGRGMIKRSKQILVLANIAFIIVASIFLLLGFGLISLVLGQLTSILINRILCKLIFYDAEIKVKLNNVKPQSPSVIFKILLPNATKLGITSIGGFLITRSSIVIGSLYLSLQDIGSFGITKQVLELLAGIAIVWYNSFNPMISKYRIENNTASIKNIFIRSLHVQLFVFTAGGLFLFLFGNKLLIVMGSKTLFLTQGLLSIYLLLIIVESIFTSAGGMLLTKNIVPFFKASILSGIAIVLMMVIFFKYTDLGVLSMILAPLIVDFAYQAWKWPLEIKKDLNIKFKDLFVFKTN
ncbi:MAG: O-unit flippase-like protein [Paludibacter sp.]|nr:O-unit flippase-like protein [Paludibacter sp.]